MKEHIAETPEVPLDRSPSSHRPGSAKTIGTQPNSRKLAFGRLGTTAGLLGVALSSLACETTMGSGTDLYGQGSGAGLSQSPIDGAGATAATGGFMGSTGGGGGTAGTTGTGGAVDGGTGGTPAVVACDENSNMLGRAPVRRLTRFEYNNTLEELLRDTADLGNALPPELSGNGFGNDADDQPVSSFLAEQYGINAEKAALAAVDNPEVMNDYAPCYATVDPSSQASCARTFIENFSTKAFRRPLEAEEADDLVDLQETILGLSDYKTSIAAVIQAVLQSPDFLYRVELGDPATEVDGRRRLTGHEMATRLSYFFWGAPPDEELEQKAANGELSSDEEVLAQAKRLLEDNRSRPVLRFFFGKFLPIDGLTDLARDTEQYPDFSPQIGAMMREETLTFLEHEIFEGPGDWKSALTAPYTFVNQTLADYYGMDGDFGEDYEQANVDPTKRKGLLTQGAILTGTTVSNFTNPVRRGVFLLRNIMCVELPDPTPEVAESITPPDPEAAATGRQRYAAHSEDVKCATCHAVMDPPGFGLENYDAVGMWRDQENGVDIDASGQIPGFLGSFSGPLELIDAVAASEMTYSCFAEKWLSFASGRTLTKQDACLIEHLEEEFTASGYNIQELLLRITQTDAFLYLPSQEQN